MRNLVASVLTSTIITVSILSAIHFLQVYDQEGKPQIEMIQPYSARPALQAQVTSLKNEVQIIRKALNDAKFHQRYGTASEGEPSSELFNERIAKIELAIKNLSSAAPGSSSKNSQTASERIRARIDQTGEGVADQGRAFVEAKFESDSGIPLGDFASSIEDAVQDVSGIQAQGIDCRNSICKVTYASDETFSSEAEDADWLLMEKLLELSGGRLVDIMYAKDSFGSDTMYIQLN